MTRPGFYAHLQKQLQDIDSQGLTKKERVLLSPQAGHIQVGKQSVLNFCANNYLGLANDQTLKTAAKEAIDSHGLGMASVRFICGTQDIHKNLESALSSFLGTEDTILFSSCWDANGGVFEIVLGEEDAVISDALNHASIIDGIRLCKAKRFRYANNSVSDLEAKLLEADAAGARFKLVVTDGVFSMDGVIANLKDIYAMCQRYNALLMVDDSHAVGFVGPQGRGTHALHGLLGKIDILTGTFGKALGGASGGYVSGKKEIVQLLRQRARPYLFSNSLMPAIAQSTHVCLQMVERSDDKRAQLFRNADRFRTAMRAAGFTLLGEGHPIIPVLIGDAGLAGKFAEAMLGLGVYVIGFSYPVVPHGQARIRTQMSAALSDSDVDTAVAAFVQVGKQLGVIP